MVYVHYYYPFYPHYEKLYGKLIQRIIDSGYKDMLVVSSRHEVNRGYSIFSDIETKEYVDYLERTPYNYFDDRRQKVSKYYKEKHKHFFEKFKRCILFMGDVRYQQLRGYNLNNIIFMNVTFNHNDIELMYSLQYRETNISIITDNINFDYNNFTKRYVTKRDYNFCGDMYTSYKIDKFSL